MKRGRDDLEGDAEANDTSHSGDLASAGNGTDQATFTAHKRRRVLEGCQKSFRCRLHMKLNCLQDREELKVSGAVGAPRADGKSDPSAALGEGADDSEDDERYRPQRRIGSKARKGAECPYLDTISRQVLVLNPFKSSARVMPSVTCLWRF